MSAEMPVLRGSGESQKNLFATNDKTLRKAIISQKKDILADIPVTASDEFRTWMNELLTVMERNDLAASSRMLALEHKLPQSAVHKVLRSFGLVRLQKYDFFGDDEKDVQNRERLIAEIGKGLDEGAYNPLLLQFAAFTIYQANYCDASLMTLTDDVADRAASFRSIGTVTGCSDQFLEAAKADPSRRIGDLAVVSDLLEKQPTLTLWLLREEVQQHVAPEGQRAFKLALTRKAIGDAFALGADSRGLALFDALEPAGKSAMLADTQDGYTATIDGNPIAFAPKDNTSLTASLAAAMYLAGRRDEARTLIQGDRQLPAQRKMVDCTFNARTAKNDERELKACSDGEDDFPDEPDVDNLILSWALDAPQTDPYPLLEIGFSGGFGSGSNAPEARLYCALFANVEAGSICADAKRSVTYNLKPSRYEDDDEIAARKALGVLNLPEWGSITARLEAERVAGLAFFDDGDARDAYSDLPPIEPIYPAFAQNALPPELISRRSNDEEDPDWPKGWTALPQGFAPIRWESEGAQTVAISQSGFLDRGGEVGRGGYWVHLSEDGGKTWGQPLYTGLAANFPYQIEATSKLPLLNDDRLQIEVSYALIDTSSITYPPVGLRTLRRQSNLWLDVPIEALAKDSDGDGLGDLAASHLRIDGPMDEAPFVLGADDATCKGEASDPAAAVRRKILLMLTNIDEAAIREPIDRAPDAPLLSGITRAATGDNWPLFLKGHAADLACMRPLPMPVLVYGPKGEKALQSRSPDFRLLEFPSLVMNREKTRGYAVWSSGWTGGTILFWLESGEWRFRTISSWVT